MPKELKQKWLDALRSGEYKQGYCELADKNGCYCCLGVLECVAEGAIEIDPMYGTSLTLPSNDFFIRHNITESSVSVMKLVEMNDRGYRHASLEMTFPKIADFIEETVEGV